MWYMKTNKPGEKVTEELRWYLYGNHYVDNCRWCAAQVTLEEKSTWVALGDYKLQFYFPVFNIISRLN